jgi:hypothetical protein
LHSSQSRKGSHITSTTISDQDTISALLPSHSRATNNHTYVKELEHQPQAQPQPQTSPPRRNIFSCFRTHLNIPFPLFTPSFTSTEGHNNPTLTQNFNVEKGGTSSDTHFITGSTVSTAIWSGTPDEEKVDPLSPKLGTRAYRERERREKANRDSREKGIMTGALPDSHMEGVEVKREMVRSEETTSPSSSCA